MTNKKKQNNKPGPRIAGLPGSNDSDKPNRPQYMDRVKKHMEYIVEELDKITDLCKNQNDGFTYVVAAMPFTIENDNAIVHEGLVGGHQPPGSIQILVHALSTWAVQNHATFGTWVAADKRVQQLLEMDEGKQLKKLMEEKRKSMEMSIANQQNGSDPKDSGVSEKTEPKS